MMIRVEPLTASVDGRRDQTRDSERSRQVGCLSQPPPASYTPRHNRFPHDEAPMLGWFNALMPKEGRFFALFAQHATIVVAGAEALRSVLKGGDDVERYCRIVSERENEADEITRQVLIAVRRTFITPFDRTDIQDLISSLDDSIDQMNKTAKTIMLFGVRRFEPQMQQMGDIILQASPIAAPVGEQLTHCHCKNVTITIRSLLYHITNLSRTPRSPDPLVRGRPQSVATYDWGVLFSGPAPIERNKAGLGDE
jgi:uncharacterized protein DUF47